MMETSFPGTTFGRKYPLYEINTHLEKHNIPDDETITKITLDGNPVDLDKCYYASEIEGEVGMYSDKKDYTFIGDQVFAAMDPILRGKVVIYTKKE